MLYASVAEHKAAVPAHASVSLGDALVLSALKKKAAEIDSIIGKRYALPIADCAVGSISFPANIADGKTLTCGATTWTFKTTPSAGQIQIGLTLIATLVNFLTAFAADVQATAVLDGSKLTFTARQGGTPGNALALSTTDTAATVVPFAGGAHDFDLLNEINIDLAAYWINTGQEVGFQNAQSGGFKELADEARKKLEDIAIGKRVLVDALGVRATMTTVGDPISNTAGMTPFADESSPEHWKIDASKTTHEDD